MSVGEVLNSGAITSEFVRLMLACLFESNSDRVAAQVGIKSCLANLLLSSAYDILVRRLCVWTVGKLSLWRVRGLRVLTFKLFLLFNSLHICVICVCVDVFICS